jgi:hypothetical protein
VLLFLAVTLTTTLASSQLTRTATADWRGCPSIYDGFNIPSNDTTYSNWVYTDSSDVKHTFNGTDYQERQYTACIPSCYEGHHYVCGVNTTTSLSGFSTDGLYYLTATGGSGSVSPVTSQTGYINPRYIILGVTYAPPGNQSFVQYANCTLVGTSTSFTSTTSNNTGYKVAVSSTTGAKGTIPDIGGTWGWSDTTTNTYSTNFTDEQDSSSSVALSSQDTWSTKLPGPASPYVGVDHDYDVIWLWLNPLVNCTATQIGTSAATITWTGYSFDRDDISEMDIYGVYLGWLTGHLSTPGPNTSDLVPLERTWAGLPSNGQIWPAGTSPSLLNSTNTAIDPTDAAAIAAADPFSNANYTVSVPSTPAGNTTSSDGRFTLTGNQVVDYIQPPPGGQPFTQTLTESTTATQTQGKGAKYTLQLGYSWENKFTGSFLEDSWSTDITVSDTLMWTDQWSTTNTKQTGITATGSVTGPPCVVSGTVCNPVYTGPTEYEAFQDNIYNTFMFYPVN